MSNDMLTAIVIVIMVVGFSTGVVGYCIGRLTREEIIDRLEQAHRNHQQASMAMSRRNREMLERCMGEDELEMDKKGAAELRRVTERDPQQAARMNDG